jgi:hypothetical protein
LAVLGPFVEIHVQDLLIHEMRHIGLLAVFLDQRPLVGLRLPRGGLVVTVVGVAGGEVRINP